MSVLLSLFMATLIGGKENIVITSGIFRKRESKKDIFIFIRSLENLHLNLCNGGTNTSIYSLRLKSNKREKNKEKPERIEKS